MTPKADKEPLRGEAAWRAARDEVAKKNNATWERARKERVVRNAEAVARRRNAEREERAGLTHTQF